MFIGVGRIRNVHELTVEQASVEGVKIGSPGAPEPLPVLLLSSPNIPYHRLDEDDIFCGEFLSDTVVLRNGEVIQQCLEKPWKSGPTSAWQQWQPANTIYLSDKNAKLPDGPYFLFGKDLHEAWRMYTDPLDSFITSIIADPESEDYEYEIFDQVAGNGIWKTLIVPSRMYFERTAAQPLAGLRVSVKDNIKIAGIKTTLMSRAFAEMYPPLELSTAEILKVMINLGAVLVGKTKLSAFASAEEPTDQWIDFHAPFNPRADTYQSPSGSTTGGATALAGYSWLDASIGTDSQSTALVKSPHTN